MGLICGRCSIRSSACRTATKADLAGPRTAGNGVRESLQAVLKGDIAVAQTEPGIPKRMVGGIGFGVLRLVLRSFWPEV